MAVLAILIISNIRTDQPPNIAVYRLSQTIGARLDPSPLPLWYGEVYSVVGGGYISVYAVLLLFADF